MGWTVLYIAFGIVSLWLLGEVLLQYKARLRWRLLAFFGFLAVVFGVILPYVPVIALGTVAFATGQTFVTLSFRRGFSTGWALGGRPGNSKRRRREGGDEPVEMRPMDPVGEDETGHDAPPPPPAPPGEALGQESGGYDEWGQPLPAQQQSQHAQPPQGQDPDQDLYAAAQQPQETVYGDGYHDQRQQPYAEPYAGATAGYESGGYDTGAGYDGYGTPYGEQQGAPGQQQYQQDYGNQWQQTTDAYYQETPPGGVWVPQQRETAATGAPAQDGGYGYPPQQDPYPQQPPQPQQNGYDPAADQGYYYNEQQRY
ncbi:hypothetical protein ACGFX7_01380 [Streptomyces harbinensis]|uniref:hypothetical protein n=1 Tax=Streptomyces harbinensis TaxID=1176198 RepID=UPI00372466B7